MTELKATSDVAATLADVLAALGPDIAMVLTDDIVMERLLGPGRPFAALLDGGAALHVIAHGEEHKTLETAADVWRSLTRAGATRRSVLVNVGGGVVSDLGGFAAAAFKRGIRYVNIPTTLLAAVDAAVGGKTAVDFDGLKNQIGFFRRPEAVILCPEAFATLPAEQLRSGYAEMLKHALIEGGPLLQRTLDAAADICSGKVDKALLLDSIRVKERIVEADPEERGPRRVLNLGHTVGHALEEWHMDRGRPVPHGYAVAWGLVVEAALSVLDHKLDSATLHTLGRLVADLYGSPGIACDDYPGLYRLMLNDKKNPDAATVAFARLDAPGRCNPFAVYPRSAVDAAFDIARDFLD